MTEVVRAHERWRRLWRAMGADPVPDGTFDELLAAYEQPHRAYHRFDHVLDCLGLFDAHRSCAEHPLEVEISLWFHDAVYDPARDDNEARSAAWAVEVLRRVHAGEPEIDRIRKLVLATRHDVPPATPDERLLLDIDLSILGRSPAAFRAYEEEIRREYAWVPEALYHRLRADLLERFLGRTPLYRTEPIGHELEEQARSNLVAAVRAHRAASRGAPAPELDGSGTEVHRRPPAREVEPHC